MLSQFTYDTQKRKLVSAKRKGGKNNKRFCCKKFCLLLLLASFLKKKTSAGKCKRTTFVFFLLAWRPTFEMKPHVKCLLLNQFSLKSLCL